MEPADVQSLLHNLAVGQVAEWLVRSVHPYPGIEIKVPVDEMADDRATLVAVDVHFAETALAGHALVIDVPTFRELAHREVHRSDVSYRAEVDLSAPHTRWAP